QVDMTKVSAINRLSRRIENGELDRFGVRSELQRISQIRSHYKRWQVVLMVGLACAAFSRLFGGDAVAFGMTFVASAIATFVRQELSRRHFNMFLVVIATAFVAGLIASVPSAFEWGDDPQIALASSVLLLVPGVALINSADDIIKGHLVTGITRGISGGLVSMGIALGLSLAMEIMGVSGL
ncbi:partial Inner membrane protein YjjP, partial [Anaerolineae bacterium]